MKKENIISQEFTLPFVGREEELKFLLDEYDQMLHAQYRSIWIEAPAGMGKTTLVEEFLKRISVGAAPLPLKPWIVHAHLRERSSNSLASFVEALGVTLQTLTEQQREKLFGGLTSFYQERAKKIVGGGNVQSMDMEEAITTAGYILKRLSYYFPLVVIIEDIHVLKGELSFNALRHLQAIAEQVPMLMVFISRPNEEKSFKQFQGLTIKEACKKYELGGLKYEDVEKIVSDKHGASGVKKLMNLSGGNALLLRELLRTENINSTNSINSSGSTTEKIVRYLLKELEQLSKKDRQVIAIAGMLGEEFSERLLQEISENKDFRCWNEEVLTRLEQRGILKRRKKVLKPEGGEKEISMRVSVFVHALWWEAARLLYNREKAAKYRHNTEFARTIVPLVAREDYPLLTDAELIVNLFRWLDRKYVLPLLRYVATLCGFFARWHFHSSEEYAAILREAHSAIVDLLKSRWFRLEKHDLRAFIDLLNAEQFAIRLNVATLDVHFGNYGIIRSMLEKFLDDDPVLQREAAMFAVDEARSHFASHLDTKFHKSTDRYLAALAKRSRDDRTFVLFTQALRDGIGADGYWFNDPERAAAMFYRGATRFGWNTLNEQNMMAVHLTNIAFLPVSRRTLQQSIDLAEQLRRVVTDRESSTFIRIFVYRALITLLLRSDEYSIADERATELELLSVEAWHMKDRLSASSTLVKYFASRGRSDKARGIYNEIFSDRFSSVEEQTRFTLFARSFVYTETWELFERLWERYKFTMLDHLLVNVFVTIEARADMCIITGRWEGLREVLGIIDNLLKRYPVARKELERIRRKLGPFTILAEGSLVDAKKLFAGLEKETSLSGFDRAFNHYMFACAGVACGHDPKDFSKHVKNSLEGFAKLGLAKRVVFTAEKLYELQLLSKKELQKLKNKYPDSENEKKDEMREKIVPPRDEQQITLNCFGRITAVGPDGKEMIAQRWGKRISVPSQNKRIVVELVCAYFEHRCATRKELLAVLFPDIKNGRTSERRIAKLERTLSVCLSQLKQSFSQFELFEKTSEGYRLNPSVRVDIVEAKQAVTKAEALTRIHPPSARWLLLQAERTMGREEFAKEFNNRQINAVRAEVWSLLKKSTGLLKTLDEAKL